MSRPSDMGKAVSKRATSNSPRQLQNDDILDTDPHQPYNVSFANHDQLLEVEVYAPDNAFNSDNTQSSEESEQEISFRQTDESDVDPETDQAEECYQPEQAQDVIEDEQLAATPSTSTREQIRDVDREMKNKLLELQKLMVGGGLTEAADQIEETLRIHSAMAQGTNCNQNSTSDR